MCNCRWTEFVLAIIILVFTIWPTQIFPSMASMWIVIVAAALLLLHSIFHHRCNCATCRPVGGRMSSAPGTTARPAKKATRKKSSRRRRR